MNNQFGKNLAAVSGKNVSIDPEEHYDLWAKQYEKELLAVAPESKWAKFYK